MKKLLFLLLFIVNLAFGQSVTIIPTQLNRNGGISTDISIIKSNDYPTIYGYRSGGTQLAPTSTTSGMELFRIGGGGYNGSFFFESGRISFLSSETWTSGSRGTKMTFRTTSNGTSAISERMVIDHDGKVGIGLVSPNQILDINGRMRIRHTPGFTSGVWMSNSTNSLSDADGAFLGLENDNKLGIYINNAWRFGVNNSGEISTTSMVGSGYRMVLASPNGVLSSNFQPQVWSITGSAFEPITGGVAQFSKGLYSSSFNSGSSIMVAPVNLPTGVEISEIKVFFKDASASSDMLIRLSYQELQNSNIGGVSIGIVGNLTTSNVTGIQSSNLTLSNSFTTIDNANRAYFIEVRSSNWDSNLEIYGIKNNVFILTLYP